MADEGLIPRLTTWVETSGRALELRTARSLRRASTRLALQEVTYEDVETGTRRPGDVLAVYQYPKDGTPAAVSLEVAVECKAGKDHPWVAFYDEGRFGPAEMEYYFLTDGKWHAEYRAPFMQAWHSSSVLFNDRVATHAVSAFTRDGNNQAHDAVRQAMSFARARAESARGSEGTPFTAVLPVVVTQAPLFTCELSRTGEVLFKAVERFDVWLYYSKEGAARVFVMSDAAVADLAAALDSLHPYGT